MKIYYRIEQKLVAAGTPVAPPERSAHLGTASVLSHPPTVSSSRARVDREPKITAAKAILSDHEDIPDDSDSTSSDSDSADSDSSDLEKPILPYRIGPPKSKPRQEPVNVNTPVVDQGM